MSRDGLGVDERSSGKRVVVSVPWSWKFAAPRGRNDVRLVYRPSDWEVSRRRAAVRAVSGLAALVRHVRRGDHVVLATLGPTAGVFAAALRLRRPASITVFDFLYSPRRAGYGLRRLLRACVDLFIVIRRGDEAMLARRFAIPADRVRYVPWAVAQPEVFDITSTDGTYLYAAGWAHRDWGTLLRALERYPVPALLAPGGPLPAETLPEGTRIIAMPSPEEGRALAANARAVAVLLEDCEYAAGPLVLLDALAMGKPVIVSDANGNRDYVRPGVTAIVVPPRDDVALSDSLRQLWTEPVLRARLAEAAKETTQSQYTPDRMWDDLLETVLDHPRTPRGPHD